MNSNIYAELLEECKRDLTKVNEAIDRIKLMKKQKLTHNEILSLEKRYISLLSTENDLIYKIRLLSKNINQQDAYI